MMSLAYSSGYRRVSSSSGNPNQNGATRMASKEIALTKGFVTIVDEADYDWLNQWKWCAHSQGYAIRTQNIGYKNGKQINKTISMHRVIMEAPDDMDVDHINGDVRDNRRCNLRVCTTSENLRNKISKVGFSKYKGVGLHGYRKKWRSYITVDNKHISLGYFASEREAAEAYNEAAKKYFGEFAKLNFIGENCGD